MENKKLQEIQKNLLHSYFIYERYNWLLDCYVLDFFTEEHWNKLLKNWQVSLRDLSAAEIADLLDSNITLKGRTWPLSILALKSVITKLSLPRTVCQVSVESPCFLQDEKILKLFWKNVKVKKRHEISIMSKICYASAKKTDCFYIVDIGSGLGHLSRMLNYGFGFKVCAIEAQEILCEQAKILDRQFESFLTKKHSKIKTRSNIHVHRKIKSTISPDDFLSIIMQVFNINCDTFKFGIVGLHPCGDLGATLLKLYNSCSNAVFINMVGCCYMKLTTLPDPSHGFPLSQYNKTRINTLSYHSREIACHAIESYVQKLRQDECWRLKIHTYRAMLEKIITEKYSEYRHCALNNVKYTQNLSFEENATRKLPVEISQDYCDTENYLNQWKEVVVFYSLRLLFAPLIESIILMDRLTCVLESGSQGDVISVFDPLISPRTHVLTARKNVPTFK